LLALGLANPNQERIMKQLSILAAFVMLGTSVAFAVTPGADSPTGEGTKGEQGDRAFTKEEGSKTQGPAAQEASKPKESASSGASAPATNDGSFTHGESKRCESMSGAAKEQCDKEEGTKTEGASAIKQ
jgi:hypothetical protein